MINKPFFNSCWLLGSWYLKECICAFLFSLYVNNFGKKYPNRWDFQNRILNDFFLSLKDKKLKRCPSCNVLPFSLDRLGQDFSCRLRTHCGCFCASWVSLLFCFFLPHIAKLSGNISFKETWFLQLHIPTKQKRFIFAKKSSFLNFGKYFFVLKTSSKHVKATLFLRSKVLLRHFYLPKVIIQV